MEWHQGELFPRVGIIVTNMSCPLKGIVRFYNGRGMAEQWIDEGKYALNCSDLSSLPQVRGQLGEGMAVRLFGKIRIGLAYPSAEGGNSMGRLVLPKDLKHVALTSLQTRPIKMGGRLVRHARRLVVQLAEVLVLPRKEGNAGRDTRTDQPASAGAWLACFEGTGIYDSYGVVQRK